MPFTPAHTAIVLPFLRSRYVSATGLIIGTMAPDFEYFFKMSVNSRYSHTLAGLLYFDVPVVLLLALLFHQVVKAPLFDNLPPYFQRRFYPLRQFSFLPYLKKNVWIFMLSALAGGLSHIAWDGFTHNDGYFVTELPFIYEGVVVPLDGARYPLWYALQHISTFVGLTALLVYIVMQKPEAVPVKKPQPLYWLLVVLLAFLITGLRFGFVWSNLKIGNLVVTIISAFCLALLVMGIVHRFKGQSVAHG